MERKRSASSIKSQVEQGIVNGTGGQVEVMSITQIKGLVRLLDRSDVSELEVKSASEDVHLVLRKIKAVEGAAVENTYAYTVSSDGAIPADEPEIAVKPHLVVAPLVGVFHPWLKPRGDSLAAVGDHVKVGQLIGTIESLNVFNEIETMVAGQVVEVHVQDGQPVEYGQVLLTIERLVEDEV
ncbi:MAG: acetyl-CoA carboxylase biotin carboxyl carrier protein [Ktedonobacteraceae bacterium]